MTNCYYLAYTYLEISYYDVNFAVGKADVNEA